MTRRRPDVVSALTLWLVSANVGPAAAHGFGQRYDLPIPLSFYLWGSGLPRMRIPRHGFAGAVIGDRLHVVGGGMQTAGIPGAVLYTDTQDVFDFTKN